MVSRLQVVPCLVQELIAKLEIRIGEENFIFILFLGLDNSQMDPMSCSKGKLEDGFGLEVNEILLCLCGKLKATNTPSSFAKIGMSHFEDCCEFTSENNNDNTNKIHCILFLISSFLYEHVFIYLPY